MSLGGDEFKYEKRKFYNSRRGVYARGRFSKFNLFFFYSSLVDNSFNQITVKKKRRRILGPNLDVFLFFAS